MVSRIKAQLYGSEATEFLAAEIPSVIDEAAKVPCAGQKLTGADKQAVLFFQNRSGGDRAQSDTVDFHGDLHFRPRRLEGEMIPKRLWDCTPPRLVDLHMHAIGSAI